MVVLAKVTALYNPKSMDRSFAVHRIQPIKARCSQIPTLVAARQDHLVADPSFNARFTLLDILHT